MKNICFIGNSHVTALRLGHKRARDLTPNFDVAYFVLPNRLYQQSKRTPDGQFGIEHLRDQLTKEDAAVVEQNCNGFSIDLRRFDAVVHVGAYLHLAELAEIVATHSIPSVTDAGKTPMSANVFRTLCAALAQHSLPPHEICDLDCPIVAITAPVSGEGILAFEEKRKHLVRVLRTCAQQPGSFKRALEVFFAQIVLAHRASGIRLVRQPMGTINDMGLTQRAYQLRNGDTPGDDYSFGHALHMNAAYGEIILQRLYQVLSEL